MIAKIARKLVRRLPISGFTTSAALMIGLGVALATPASAVSSSVRNACMGDYFQFCAGMEVGSQELRRCFNRNGAKLSSSCVGALVAAGEVSKREVNRRAGTSKVASVAKKKKRSFAASSGRSGKSAKRQYAALR